MTEMNRLPSTYPPTLVKISSPIRIALGRRVCGISRVDAGPDTGQIHHEIHREHDQDQHVGQRAEHGFTGAQQTGGQSRTGTVGGLLDQLLDVETVVELAEQRIVVLDLLQQRGHFRHQLGGLLDDDRDRGGEKPAHGSDPDDEHDGDRRPARKLAADQPGHRGFDTDRQEQRQSHDDQDVADREQELDHAVVTATPAAAAMPIRNGERRLSGLPIVPSGRSGVLICAASASAFSDRAFLAGVRLSHQVVIAFHCWVRRR
jgi:hypothetical protein